MAGGDSAEKTEKPTPKRKKEGVKEGQVARSQDLGAWATVLALTFVLPGLVSGVLAALETLFTRLPDVTKDPTVEGMASAATEAAGAAAVAILPLLAVTAAAALVAGVAQGGARPYGARLKPKFSRMSPLQGVKRMFGPQSLWELVKSLLKTAVVAVLAWNLVRSLAEVVMSSGTLPLTAVVSAVGAAALQLVRVVAVVALVIGVADWLVSKRRVDKQMRMSRKDIRDEMKQADGDPQVKAALRRRALMLTRNRMMADIPTADVVLVNPTHVAVALVYTPGRGAPRVVAKGAGEVAARIRKVASESRVPMVENVPLARALHKACEVGDEIPPEMFTAVAQVLAFVMGLRARGAAAGLHRSGSLALAGSRR